MSKYSSIELFAGCGGLALGMEMAGFHHILLNDFDKYCTKTLKLNRPNRNIIYDDISNISFSNYKGKVDVLTGGYPCQAFSYAGKKMGLDDGRGVLFLEFARAINESKPKIFIAENVKGLLSHDGGKTILTMIEVFKDLGYHVYEPKVLKAIDFGVPQKRERVIIVGVREDLYQPGIFNWPKKLSKNYTLKDALKKGNLFDCDVPKSKGSEYPEYKKKILDLVPPGGYRRDLPEELQKEYMGNSYYLGGGKTGIARRISRDEASLTLTCSPAQKQTERCHPDETRPFTVREYARIQTFPDDRVFYGGINQQYKQIGNAVPVNLALYLGKEIKKTLDKITTLSVQNITHETIQPVIYKGSRLISAC